MQTQHSKATVVLSCLVLTVRLGLGVLFLWSGISKIRHPYQFLSAIYDYEFVGPKLGMIAAMTLPWLELLIGICLVAGLCMGGALLGASLLASLFTVVQASAIFRGLVIDCGCFGPTDSEPVSTFTLLRSTLMLIVAIAAFVALLRLPVPPESSSAA